MDIDLTVIGNTNLDVLVGGTDRLPDPGTETVVGDIDVRLGGSAGNMALRAAQLGVRTRLVSRVGDDAVAGLLEQELDHPTLERRLLESSGAATPLTVAVEAPGRDRAFLSSLGAMAHLTSSDVADEWLTARFVALNGSFLLPGLADGGARELLGRARARGATTLLDTGWPPAGWDARSRDEVRDLLQECDVFLPNADEAVGLTEHVDPSRAAAHLAETTSTVVVLKCGARGAEVHRPGLDPVSADAPPTTVVDSTGAGDSFNAALVAGLLRGERIDDALCGAVTFASRVVATPSAQRRLLTADR